MQVQPAFPEVEVAVRVAPRLYQGLLMPEERDETLTVDRLTTGDRPSLMTLGVVGAQSIRVTSMAVFMVDVLGRVRIMPTEAVKVLIKPKVLESELDELEEDQAIQVKVAEEATEDEILDYLNKRNIRLRGIE